MSQEIQRGASSRLDRDRVLYVLAMYASPTKQGLPLRAVREYSGVAGRPLAAALTSLRMRGLAWRGISGCWRPTDRGAKEGRA